MNTERWMPAAGYDGSYEVSDQGRIRSLVSKPRIMSAWPVASGHLQVGSSRP